MRLFHSPVSRALLITCCLVADNSQSADIDFDRDIRPILSDTCFACHGPDQGKRVNELRLDTKEGLFSRVDGGSAVVPGDAHTSLLLTRVMSQDPDIMMPPPESGRKLTREQIELFRQWIEEGAHWESHWSFVAPQRPTLPAVKQSAWCENAIDRFILSRIESVGIQPASMASRETLLRRVTLDLTGLPPTLAEIEAFVTDHAPDAWQRVVDRLLQSPRYGEHMASDWLDAARYADTSGYQSDGPRDMWRWRDWVIDALNVDMPFDQFTIEQLAGDLLENPSLDQQIATGFNRNHRGNAEGGIVAEEYQVEYVVDRVDTTCTVWLGLTMGCARCHDHKYDPLTQEDFYRLFAYFNNIPENGRALKEGNSPPYIKAPTPEMRQELARLGQQVRAAESRVHQLDHLLRAELLAWESSPEKPESIDWTIRDGLLHRFQLDGNLANTATDDPKTAEVNSAVFLPGKNGTAIQLDGDRTIAVGDVANFGYFDKFSIAAWVKPADASGTIISRMTPVEQGSGYYLHLEDGRLQVNLVVRWLDDSIRVTSRRPLAVDQWQHIVVTYDGSRRADGIRGYLNGEPLEWQVEYDWLNQTFAVDEPLRLGGGHSNFSGLMDDVQIYDRVLSASEAAVVAVPESIAAIRAMTAPQRSTAQSNKMRKYFVEHQAAPEIRDAYRERTNARRRQERFDESLPTVMVMQEMETPRQTRILKRGQYDAPDEEVTPGTPAILPSPREGSANNRLGLAEWLISPDHPLTARVTVNRIWQKFFGTGIVKTAEDFGSQGDLPSHPLLLDFLATELIRSGWDLKAIERMIVLSATYRQSSLGSAELRERDPENRLLARAPKLRLPAETVRDQALFISGLLNERIGGESVRPYQPEGLWQEIATTTKYERSQGADLYRRSLYTYWKRTVAPPTMVTLDATARESCTIKRSRTNTPLQALALMNEITFVESARVLAERLLAQVGQSPQALVSMAFQMATSRHPTSEERDVLLRGLHRYRDEFAARPEAAEKLLAVGESPPDKVHDPVELAAWTTVVSLILNLDEFINKE